MVQIFLMKKEKKLKEKKNLDLFQRIKVIKN